MTQAIIYDGARAGQANDLVARVRKAIADYRLYLATMHELEQLSDRDLGDLGIHRALIREIAHESVYGA